MDILTVAPTGPSLLTLLLAMLCLLLLLLLLLWWWWPQMLFLHFGLQPSDQPFRQVEAVETEPSQTTSPVPSCYAKSACEGMYNAKVLQRPD